MTNDFETTNDSSWRGDDGIYNAFVSAPTATPLEQRQSKFNQNQNLHETGQIISYRPENHRFRLECLRPETWYQ